MGNRLITGERGGLLSVLIDVLVHLVRLLLLCMIMI